MMLDLPQPFGPTTAVIFDGNATVVASTNDLNPDNFMDFNRIDYEARIMMTSFDNFLV
ncbi:hypothetical protein MRBBS_1718 [Marinobacter sp. BSs20148]|nr:hypothetical protein MRBBS_1718 [Marinobacter sp. BSs20148]